MEKKAYGGFAITDRQGQVIIGKGGYDANGAFTKQQSDSLSISPSPAILDELAAKGLLDRFIFANQAQQKDATEQEKTI